MKNKKQYIRRVVTSISIIALLLSYNLVIAQDVSATERQALIDLYNATNGPNWTNNTNWNTSAPVSDWFGVTVTNGLITGVNLNNTGLSGNLPATLGNLSNITEIYLIGNNLSGSIPVQLGNLSNLEYLYLYFNNLSGSIPLELGNLSNLKHLYLYSNNLSGGIPSELGSLLNLEFLSLSDNQLTGSIPPQLGNLSKLQGLSLDKNQLTGSIPNELGSLLELKRLNFNANMLTGTIPSVLGDLANLELLKLSLNQLTGSIPVEIANLAQLKEFKASYNRLDGDIPFELSGLTNLNFLAIRNNNFVFTNFEDVHATFQNILAPLNYPYFPQAKVDQEETLSVAENGTITLTSTALTSPNNSYQWFKDGVAISGANSKDYVISSAATTDAGVYHFEATNSVVTGLTLTRNTITLTIDPPVDTCGVSETEKQALLDLYNSTNGDNWTNTLADNQPWDTNIPVCDWFGVTVVDGKVIELELQNNSLSGSLLGSLQNLSSLRKLYLYANNITGILPSEIGSLNNLEHLWLMINSFSGNIPISFGNLNNLKTLELYKNELTGLIPISLSNIPTLVEVQLFDNQLTGNIPMELINSTNLSFLNVANNQLDGIVPNFLNTNLNQLRLKNNSFVFSNFETEHDAYKSNLASYNFSPQAKVDQEETLSVAENGTITLTSTDLSSSNNSYQWFKDGVAISGATSKDYVISSAATTDAGVYHFEATNSIVTGLTLTRNNITLTIDPPVDTCGVSETEKQALLDLYNSTNGDNWTNTLANNQPWDTSIPVCDWFGVTVVDGKVITLEIGGTNAAANNNLNGNLPTSIGDLINLRTLIITQQGNLTGNIPTSLGQLSSLKNLDLKNNSLTGAIPSELGQLSNIETLRISFNTLTGIVPSELGQLSNLISIDLNSNQLSGIIPLELSQLTNLEVFTMEDNALTGVIPSELGQLLNLRVLYLRRNELSGVIPPELGQLSNLEVLNLKENELTGTIPSELGQLSNLITINLDTNELSGIIPSELGQLPSIDVLDFMENNFVFSNFENEHLAYISSITNYRYSPQSKVDLEETLSVAENGTITLTSAALTSPNNSYQWYKDGVAISGATSKDYVISSAVTTDAGVYHFEATNSIVTGLTLTRNNITLSIDPPVATCGVSESEKQALLDLYNSTNGANWTNTLANNQPWDTNIPVCDWFGVTVVDGKVTGINLPNNALSGTLPISLGNLVNIKTFFLHQNQLSGSIPTEIGQLTELYQLVLHSNQLTGSIPPELGELSKLGYLFVYNNQLTGSIPNELGQLTNLFELGLQTNQLSGTIPSELGQLTNLVNLRLDNNQLRGTIPEEVSFLSNLTNVIINNNQLSGEFPNSLISLDNLNNLQFHNNQFIFSNFENEHPIFLPAIGTYIYAPQAKVDQEETLSVGENGTITLTSNALTSPNNSYQWFKDGVAISGANSKDYVISSAVPEDAGVYHFEATNSVVTGLTLTRNNITLEIGAPVCGVSEPERLALLDLYANTNGDNWTNTLAANQPWDINISVCDWYGVTVEDGKVTALQLPNNALNGNLPENIGSLLHIKNIDLGNNQITGEIPVSMGSLSELETLNIANNTITGIIPPALGSLSNLIQLDLSNNIIDSQIPISFCNLANVTDLDLSFNNLNGSIPREIELMRSLVNLNLSNNQLSNRIPNTFVRLFDLESLQIQNNELSGSIPFSLSSFTKLEYFTFENNKFIFSDFESRHTVYASNINSAYTYNPQAKTDTQQSLSVTLGNTITLTTVLDSPNNSYQWYKDGIEIPNATNKDLIIENAGPEDIGDYYFVATNSIIENLSLTRNTITLDVIDSCDVPLVERQALIALYNATNGDNWSNTLSQQQPWDINNPNSLVCDWYGITVENNTIKNIILPNNNLEGEVPFTELIQFPDLGRVDLSNNQLSGTIENVFVTPSPSSELFLENNNYIFEDIEMNWDAIFANGIIFIYEPQAKVDSPETINVELGASITLTSTQLTSVNNSYQWYKNGLPIAGATTKDYIISSATSEDAGGYHFTATNSIVNNLTLEREMVMVQVNAANDPCGVSDLERQALITLYNAMDGPNWTNNSGWNTEEPVCNWYGVVTDTNANVIGLTLAQNNLRGEIPTEITQIIGLTEIDFSENQIVGQIPTSLDLLTSLETLLLNDNILVGEIPTSITNAASLITLNISNNRLTGAIPASIGNLQQLQYLDAANNKLTGTLPSGLYTISSLNRINVSKNRINGGISNNIGNLGQLEEFWLAENNFSGNIPTSITNIPTLRSVRLNNNSFKGDIPVLIPDFSVLNTEVQIENNRFVFSDFEAEYPNYSTQLDIFTYDPQARVDSIQTIPVLAGNPITLGTLALTSPNNSYIWYKDNVAIPGATEKNYTITNFDPLTDIGTYHFIATNSTIANLELRRNPITLTERVITPLQDLVLTALCSDNPDTTREWQITNPNSVNVSINWEVLSTSQSGTVDLTPGTNLLSTNTEITDNTLRITWNLLDGSEKTIESISNSTHCNPQADCTNFLNGIADGSFENASTIITNNRNGDLGNTGWTATEGTPDTFLAPLTNTTDTFLIYNFNNSPNNGVCAGALRDGNTTESFATEVTGLTSGTTYIVEFFQANATNLLIPELAEEANGSWQVNFGTVVKNSNFLSPNSGVGNWQKTILEFVATTSTQTLEFAAASSATDSTNSYPVYMLIDGIRIYVKPEQPFTVPCTDIDYQVFCNQENDNAIVGNLISSLGTNVTWYDSPVGGTPYSNTTELAELISPYVWADDSSGNSRVALEVIFDLGAPIGDDYQSFSSLRTPTPTLADIQVEGTGITWHDSFTNTAILSSNTPLTNGSTYYAAQNGNACRLAVEVFVGILDPIGDGYQEFCSSNNPTINSLSMVPSNPSYTIVWYSEQEGGTIYNTSDVLSTGTYYAAQKDGTNVSENRVPVTVSIIDVDAQAKLYERDAEFPEGNTIAELTTFFGLENDIKWYDQANGGTAYFNNYALISNETYYARIGEGICDALEVLAVTVTTADVVSPELITCIKFIPQPGDTYVISGWVREDEIVAEPAGTKEFNTDTKAQEAFKGLLQNITTRILFKEEIPTEEFFAKTLFPDLDLTVLIPYIKNFTGNNVKIYDFKLEKENVFGVQKSIGFSFSLDAENNSRFVYKTPQALFQPRRSRPNRTYPTGVKLPIRNYEGLEIEFTDVKVVNNKFQITSNINIPEGTTYRSEYKNQITLSETNSGIEESIQLFTYSENPDYQAMDDLNSSIELSYKDETGADMGVNNAVFTPRGAIIDGWQRISSNFTIPTDAAYMKIALRNNSDGLNAYFDDVRMHPFDSNMKSFVYDPITQRLQAELDENNYATFYEYDTEGGLVRVKKETERGVYTIQETRSGNSKINRNGTN